MDKTPKITAEEYRNLGNKQKRKSKYNNIKSTGSDGFVYDSKKEHRRYPILQLRQKMGEISELQRQPEYEFSINGVLVCKYRGDYAYIENGQRVVEDCKGVRTGVYIIKKKLMLACYNIEIKET